MSWQKFKPGASQIKICEYYLYANLLGVDIIYSASILEILVVTSKTFLLELWIVTYFKRAWLALKNLQTLHLSTHTFGKLVELIYVLSTYHTFHQN